jgi:hypothetical protein
MLSNRIWIMPTADRASGPDSATIFYRCGSQRGKPVRTVSSSLAESDFNQLTAEFVLAEATVYRKARAGKQKNAARNLKKYLDAEDIRLIEDREGVLSLEEIVSLLL